jgi:hypothetical protein
MGGRAESPRCSRRAIAGRGAQNSSVVRTQLQTYCSGGGAGVKQHRSNSSDRGVVAAARWPMWLTRRRDPAATDALLLG